MDELAASYESSIQNTATTRTVNYSSSSWIFTNYPLISGFVAFALAQSIKFFTSWYKERHWDLKKLVGSGGMPSSHSATVTALAVAVGFQDGFGGSLFATALTLACVVLNQIVYELPAEHPLAESIPLRELLGHTPPQVIAGGLLGFVTAAIGHMIARSGGQAWNTS
ncbi:acid phosphatase/vanadium-dependent haloperoxidase-related protein [Actinidia rufa]|uniref:Acid phosphatase/vanadium-dependent haloperoxidase-related protein n=1 Tax=Actinidia rufa TaxID=165716 RepID=A0A7J0EYL6_9ERIC|nr:acid phosphatase/vanadium-dependent haloperoxidase-related protein [Actinidia rufa]